jgi:hypothetical protein
MKAGSSIVDLASRLQAMRDNAKDFVVPPAKLENVRAATHDGKMVIEMVNGHVQEFQPSKWAHAQLADYSAVPKAYYDRLNAENPALLADNVNHGFELARSDAGNTGRMLRTHAGTLRAMVSTRFRRLDNFDLFEAIAPALIELGFEPESAELTDRRLYLKCVSPRVTSEVKKGDVVQYGLVVSNSDVGAGSLRVEPMVFRLVCLNGMIANVAKRHAHLGRNLVTDDVEELLTDQTRQLTDRAFWGTVRDVVTNFAKPEHFEREVNRLRTASDVPIKMFDLPTIIERTAKAIGVTTTEATRASILDNLASGAHGAGMNKWGLSNAFTFAAQAEHLDYDAATDLERAGSQVIDIAPSQWEAINAQP